MSAIDLPPPPSVPEPAAEATAGVAFDDLARGQMERMLSDLGRVYRERNAAWKDLEQAHLETLLRLAVAAELRDDDTGIHIVRLGFLAEALERAALTVRSQLAMEGKIGALTAQGKLQAVVVGILPLALLLVLDRMEPEAMGFLWHSPPGWATLAVIATLEVLGVLLIRRIVAIDV